MSTPVYKTQSITTVPYRVNLAAEALAGIVANTYLGIGMNLPWANSDANITTPNQSTDYFNSIRRNLVAIKKIYASSGALVVPRVDWVANTYYNAYANSIDMFATSGMSNANGTVNVVAGNTTVVGSNTTFLLNYSNNSLITIPGDNVYVLPQTREIINVVSNTIITVNSAFTSNAVANIPQQTINTSPYYYKNFYVRNTYDQVFVCLNNNNGIASNSMPQLSLGGQLPSNPYITTADGYLWKYLYTISGGYKQSFFTTQWMPVITDTTVYLAATDGRLDIINITNGGSGYNNVAASFSTPILVVTGDGSGANLTAQVDANGTIYGINILNGGSGYTTATITANAGANGVNANLQAVIGPQGGWGSNAATELGATNLMISVNLVDTENATIPTVDAYGDYFTYRQVLLIDSPIVTATGNVANSVNYDMTTVVQVSSNGNFHMNDTVWQSNTGLQSNAFFTATVVWFDTSTNQLHLNNLNGTFSTLSSLYSSRGVATTSVSEVSPSINLFSGKLMYIENRAAVTRSPGQTENIKLILQF